MPVDDLRQWIDRIDEMGQLTRVDGADPRHEIGGLVDLYGLAAYQGYVSARVPESTSCLSGRGPQSA